MFKLFTTERYEYNYPIKKYSKFDYIKRRYLDELDHVLSYYHNKDFAVNNNHILNRLITNLAPSINIDPYDYLNKVSVNARLLSKQFNIVSNINSGEVMDNIFFGKGSREILLYRESLIDLDYIEEHYMDIDSVRVIYTDSTDLDFYLPFNKKVFTLPALNIMSIDITTLLMQYRYWALGRVTRDSSTNPNVFIAQVILPNMIPNMLDFAIWNRYTHLALGQSIPSFKIDHPFTVLDYSTGIDKVLSSIVKDTKDVNQPLVQTLLSVPTIYNKDMLSTLHIGHKFYTKQSEWALWLARTSIIADLLNLLNSKGIRRNTDLLNTLPVLVKQMKRSATGTMPRKLNHMDDVMLLADFEMSLDIIKKKIGRR